jgi:hypothetical protein
MFRCFEPSCKTMIGDICPECGEAAVVNEEGCPSVMLLGLASADMKKTSEVWHYVVL